MSISEHLLHSLKEDAAVAVVREWSAWKICNPLSRYRGMWQVGSHGVAWGGGDHPYNELTAKGIATARQVPYLVDEILHLRAEIAALKGEK